MINIDHLFWAVFTFVLLFKSGLILVWTRRLHDRHGARYGFAEIFRMMFGPQSQSSLDPAFWKDFEPIQKWNFWSNVILGVLAASIFFGGLSFNRALR